jgi:enamine deaminase RidA (YjgF/YER057c/UK114 family)
MIKRTFEHGHVSAVEHDGVLYLGGVAAEDLTLPIEGQMRQVVAEVERVLTACGSSKSQIINAKVNLARFADKDEMHAVWLEWLGNDALPARSTNGNLDLGEGVLVEVVVTAAA